MMWWLPKIVTRRKYFGMVGDIKYLTRKSQVARLENEILSDKYPGLAAAVKIHSDQLRSMHNDLHNIDVKLDEIRLHFGIVFK